MKILHLPWITLLTALKHRIIIPTLYAMLAVRWGVLGSAKTCYPWKPVFRSKLCLWKPIYKIYGAHLM